MDEFRPQHGSTQVWRKILYEKQYGFQTAKSTEDAIIDITQNILNSLEKKNTLVVFS